MTHARSTTAIVVTTYRGQRSAEETARLSASGRIPRNNAVEVARLLGADIIDSDHMAHRATWPARAVAAVIGLPAGQAVEALLRRRRYRSVLAWADRIGLPLALMNKLTRGRQDLVLLTVDLSRPKKRVFLERFGVHSHLRAVVASSSVQIDLAGGELGVPADKLVLLPYGVDTQFWRPEGRPAGRRVCAVGWEERDYPTFVEAVTGLDADVEVALGSLVLEGAPKRSAPAGAALDAFADLRGTAGYEAHRRWLEQLEAGTLPSHIRWHQQLDPEDLRALYARSSVVVIPLHDVPFDAGYTAILEAMAMGKPLVVTRTRGQVDLLRDGVHGLYVEPGDPAALRTAVERLLADPDEAERMGRAGRRLVEERYTLDGYVQRLSELVGRDRRPAEAVTQR